jgi:AcrR family transcriptional regulator
MPAHLVQHGGWETVAVAAATKRTERLAPELRREMLLDAALELAGEHGFTHMTVEAVARQAEVTRPVVYDLFGDLAGLLMALLEREEARALAALAEIVPSELPETDPDDVLVDGVGDFLDAVRRQPRTWRLLLLPPEGSPPALRERVGETRRALAAHIASLLDWGIERCGGPRGLDTEVLARLLVAVSEDAARLMLTSPRRHPPERMVEAARAVLALLPPAPARSRAEPSSGRT